MTANEEEKDSEGLNKNYVRNIKKIGPGQGMLQAKPIFKIEFSFGGTEVRYNLDARVT